MEEVDVPERPVPGIKSNWTRLLVYFIFIFLFAGIFYIPLIFVFPELNNKDFDFHQSSIHKMAVIIGLSGGVVTATWFMIYKIEGRKINFPKISKELKSLNYGVLIALVLMLLFALTVQTTGIVSLGIQPVDLSNTLFGLIFYLFVAINEEMIFRGYVLFNLREKLGVRWSMILSSAFFGLAHLSNPHVSFIGVTTIAFSGLLMSIMTIKLNSISFAIGLHWFWNFVQGNIFGLSVSGNQEVGIFKPLLSKAEWLTGGSFGAEGSLILTIITALACFLFVKGSRQDAINATP